MDRDGLSICSIWNILLCDVSLRLACVRMISEDCIGYSLTLSIPERFDRLVLAAGGGREIQVPTFCVVESYIRRAR